MTNSSLPRIVHDPTCTEYEVETAELGSLGNYRFVVVFARYMDKWLYCRMKDNDTYGNAGGHIEEGETPLEAAKRELYEETGALDFDITPTFDYSVRSPTAYATGQVFLAHIHKLGELPDFEVAEVGLFEVYPEKLRFPHILPIIYRRMQVWINVQSAKDELWDLYDADRNLVGSAHRRGDPLPAGYYHLVVFIYLQNSMGELLITKRAPNKGDPNLWETTGGSAVAGDDSLAAAIREVKEETGLDLLPENGKCVLTYIVRDAICDTWLFKQDFDLRDVVLQENETVDAKYATIDEVCRMIENGEFVNIGYDVKDFFERLG